MCVCARLYAQNLHERILPPVQLSRTGIYKKENTRIKSSNREPAFSQRVMTASGDDCFDTSFTKLIGLKNQWMYVNATLHTSDDGALVSGNMFDSSKKHGDWNINGFIVKTDNKGDISWIRQFADADRHKGYYLSVFNVFELSNKDIIAVGAMDTTRNGARDVTVIFRLDKNGNLVWYVPLRSSLATRSSGVSLNIRSATEGLNGDLILCGTTLNSAGDNYQTIIRMDASGEIIWDANYGNSGAYRGGANGLGAFFVNGNIVECGISVGSLNNSYLVAINFLTLDYATGNILQKKFIVPDYANDQQRTNRNRWYGQLKCTKLDNGHYTIYGGLYPSFSMDAKDTAHYFAITEFDPAFNIADAYTISATPPIGLHNDFITIAPDGKTLYSFGRYPPGKSLDLFMVSEKNHQFLKSRKVHYDRTGNAGNIGFAGSNGFVSLNDKGYVYVQTHFDFSNGVKSYIEFKKMHDSDTSSDCLGKDTLFTMHLPYHMIPDPGYSDLGNNQPGQFSIANYRVSVSDTLTLHTKNGCIQNNNCDTISLHGNSTICGSGNTVLFTVYKNQNCGAFAQWNIDTSAINYLRQVNDTTVAIQFKNINWSGKLYAQLQSPKCFPGTPTDSLQLRVMALGQGVSLGADTILCRTQDSLVLHAGPGYAGYQWQDGSADSILPAPRTGKYFVTVTDHCGNIYSDTINVTRANYTFSVGSDTSKCNKDTIVLRASPGFSNYSWLPKYNIDVISPDIVQVYPLVDTDYIASANISGCTVFDTVHVQVFQPPVVSLGNDTSICSGTGIQLHAGPGFKEYAWNTGDTSESVYVNSIGTYNVTATSLNNCVSHDTLRITAIKPLPVFSLGNDTSLCKGQSLDYNFNVDDATYNWSTGSKSNMEEIMMPGIYWLTVTQDQCSSTDSITLYQQASPQVFWGNDTILCDQTNYILNASFPDAAYLWQDGSTASAHTVTKPGLYFVTLNVNGCMANDSITIAYDTKPFFNLGNDTTICPGYEIILQPYMNTLVTYHWQNGSTKPGITITQPGSYYLTASDFCGSYTDSLKIEEGLCKLIIPSAFTPNHDGLNDVFKIKYPFTVKNYNMIIYDRWGRQVFNSRDMAKGWDGNYKGIPVARDTFVWVIAITAMNGTKTNLHGTVSVIR
jgi:gliding motility-associated-like protein